jgi:hypothetical protein
MKQNETNPNQTKTICGDGQTAKLYWSISFICDRGKKPQTVKGIYA